MPTRVPFIVLLPVATLLASCDRPQDDFRDCSDVDVSLAEALPATLSGTGLYSDIAADAVSDAAIAFSPRFPLWTDSATKRRWLLLPAGGVVDTRDPDDWRFPVGTRTFKEFTRGGVRIETRMNLKTPDGWAAAAYLWDADGADATLQLDAAEDVAGTAHDVPGAAECQACHGGRHDFTLGFSSVQLDPDTRAALFDAGVLSDPVDGVLDLDPVAEAGLGVLHGNCSHCHNAERTDAPQATDCYAPGERVRFDLSLPADLAALSRAPALRTASEQLGTASSSKVLNRMATRNLDDDRPSMPPLGTEEVDEAGLTAVRAMVERL